MIVVQDSKDIFKGSSMITNIELLMCNLMAILLLCAVSELNRYLHLRLSWTKSGLIHTTAVATHTFQDDPEALIPYWSHFSFFRVINSDLSRKLLTRVLESDAFVSASGSSRYIYIYTYTNINVYIY